jgi:hypothetical protein
MSEKAHKRARQRQRRDVPPVRSTSAPLSRYRRRWWQLLPLVVALGAALAFALPHGGSGSVGSSSLPLGSLAALGPLASHGNPGALGSEGVPVPAAPPLAPAGSPQPGQSIDGISCAPLEQLAFHIHAHLTVFVDGKARRLPYGIGIAQPQAQGTPQGAFVVSGACFTWLHTHAADGIIHIESPTQRSFTLGNFFDVWGRPLGPGRVGAARGHVTAFVDGRPYLANPRSIPLFAHAQIQLDVGRPLVAPESITFPNGL